MVSTVTTEAAVCFNDCMYTRTHIDLSSILVLYSNPTNYMGVEQSMPLFYMYRYTGKKKSMRIIDLTAGAVVSSDRPPTTQTAHQQFNQR